MPGHDIIVIGTSAGGLKALSAIVTNLPADLNAAVLVVQHLSPDQPSLLPEILTDIGTLPAAHPNDMEEIRKGKIYVARPDHHLLVGDGYLRVVRGPKENRFRPAVDSLFRSAARTYGPRVVGVVLTGYLDDGTVGLQAVKKRGGITIVQDPREAEYPSMPTIALRYVEVDYCLPLSAIPSILLELTDKPVNKDVAVLLPKEIEIESDIAEQEMNAEALLAGVREIGTPTSYTCPECNGSIWRIGSEEPLRFRCHVGHSFTANVFLAGQTQALENALWLAVRLMEEKRALLRQMAEQMRSRGMHATAKNYEEYAAGFDDEISVVRQLIMRGLATRHTIPPKGEGTGNSEFGIWSAE